MNLGENRSIPVAVGGQPVAETGPRSTDAASAAVEGVSEPRVYHTPPVDIHEGPEGLILEADLPGATGEEIVIQLEDNVLTLHARVTPPAPEGARPLHEEYRAADFYRSFILSDEVERTRITAELNNGVLRLNLPKAERAKTRRIEIKS
jgi:HSP20 family molecular chaperone IbpA